MAVRVKVIGGERLRANLRALPGKIRKPVQRAVLDGANDVRNEILQSMRPPKGGETYTVPGTKRKYQASAPGEAPAVATGRLRGSVGIRLDEDRLGATIGVHELSQVKYAAALEFGTAKMEARPWLFPAFEKTKKRVRERIRKATDAALKRASAKR